MASLLKARQLCYLAKSFLRAYTQLGHLLLPAQRCFTQSVTCAYTSPEGMQRPTNIVERFSSSLFFRSKYFARTRPAGQACPPLPLARSSCSFRGVCSKPSKSTSPVPACFCVRDCTRSSLMAKPSNGFEVASSSDIFDACEKGIQLGGACGEKKSVKWSVLIVPSPFSSRW